jgi:hypothetical protein
MSEVERLPFGFRWGQIEVTRMAEIEGRGQVIGIEAGNRKFELYVSAKGMVTRLHERCFGEMREIPLGKAKGRS